MSTPFLFIHDLVNPKTGKTYKQENLELQHAIPIGALVEAKIDAWFGEGACWKIHARLWVVSHDRDCDGTPLYSISRWKDPDFAKQHEHFHGIPEHYLTPVTITPAIAAGEGALSWPEHDWD